MVRFVIDPTGDAKHDHKLFSGLHPLQPTGLDRKSLCNTVIIYNKGKIIKFNKNAGCCNFNHSYNKLAVNAVELWKSFCM